MPALHNVRRWRGKGPSAFATDVPLHRQVYIDLRASAVDIVNAVRSSCLAVCVNGGTAAEQEQTFFVKMTAILLLHNCGKAVDPTTEICIAAGNIEIPDFSLVHYF